MEAKVKEIDFIIKLSENFSEVKPLLEEHLQYNGEILSFVFMDELSRYLIESFEPNSNNNLLERILTFISQIMQVEEELMDEKTISSLVGTTLCASIDELYYDNPELHSRVYERTGENLRKYLIIKK